MDHESLFKNRILEHAKRAYENNVYEFSKFHSPSSISIFLKTKKEIGFITTSLNGGYEEAERKLIIFGSKNDFGYECELPIKILKISPLIAKFSDKLTHRDFLGAILNLGIDRSNIGDIIVDNNIAYVFTISPMDDFIIENLYKVKHTSIMCEKIDCLPNTAVKKEELKLNVSSVRLDAVLGAIIKVSRKNSADLIKTEKVFVNGMLENSPAKQLKNEDILSVRGYGKFKFIKIANETKKGRYNIEIEKYI